MLKCVGHPVRLRIVELLEAHGELAVHELQDELGIAQPIVSQHLTKMKALGLLRAQRKLLECIRSCDPAYFQTPFRPAREA